MGLPPLRLLDLVYKEVDLQEATIKMWDLTRQPAVSAADKELTKLWDL